jgi:DNA-binding PadR family transcriptional regulator
VWKKGRQPDGPARVFTRGRMRLYLLKLLGEQPAHGYDILQRIEERLVGTYVPSPGTVYPRLRQLEADGLVTHTEQGGRKVYALTTTGKRELKSRRAEVDALEQDIAASGRPPADELGDEIRDRVRTITEEFREAAGESGGPARPSRLVRPGVEWPDAPEFAGPHGMIEAQLQVLVLRVRARLAGTSPTSDQIGACAAILDDAYQNIDRALG